MKPLALFVVMLAVLSGPAAARADEHTHRLTIAGAVLTAVGAAMSIAGAALVTYGELNPPPPYPSAQPLFCAADSCSNVPGPTNGPLVGGVATLAVGTAALGSGIALLVVGKRGERPSVALGPGALRVRF
jgi:hypothetical protein